MERDHSMLIYCIFHISLSYTKLEYNTRYTQGFLLQRINFLDNNASLLTIFEIIPFILDGRIKSKSKKISSSYPRLEFFLKCMFQVTTSFV